MATQQFFVSNFRETLSILESLRVGKNPGRGMRHLASRPIIEDALRASETDLITNGRDGEFPILLEVSDTTKIGRQGQQVAIVPKLLRWYGGHHWRKFESCCADPRRAQDQLWQKTRRLLSGSPYWQGKIAATTSLKDLPLTTYDDYALY